MMTVFTVLLAVTSIWDYPAKLAKQPRVAAANGMVATACDEEPPQGVPAKGVAGRPLVLTDANIGWNKDAGCFAAQVRLRTTTTDGNAGDLYLNRDGNHSVLNLEEFPGLTQVTFAPGEARRRCLDRGIANVSFAQPLFANASLSFQDGYWRSLPRAMLTNMRGTLPLMAKLYTANQFYVYPSAGDTPPVGTNGDVFASIAPYWLTTAGRSWSDLPYLKAALEVSRSLDPAVKREIVRRGLLVPTIQTILRKSLKGVTTEADYLTCEAHPTAMPPNGLDLDRLVRNAEDMTVDKIPPLARFRLEMVHVLGEKPAPGEVTYVTDYAAGIVLRSPDRVRIFRITALGDDEYEIFQSHGDPRAVKFERLLNTAAVTIDRVGVTPDNRIDIAVVGKTEKSGWGAPSYVSFAVLDEKAGYCDPLLMMK